MYQVLQMHHDSYFSQQFPRWASLFPDEKTEIWRVEAACFGPRRWASQTPGPVPAPGRFSLSHACRGEWECLVSPSQPLAWGRWAVEVVSAGGFNAVLFSFTSSGFGTALSRRAAGAQTCRFWVRAEGAGPRLQRSHAPPDLGIPAPPASDPSEWTAPA